MTPDISLQLSRLDAQPSRTFYVDFARNKIQRMTDETDAVVQSAMIALMTDRGCFKIFSDNYGSELHTLVGKDKEYIASEAKRMITDTLLADDRITAVSDFNIENNYICFKIKTIYNMTADMEVRNEIL